jgi:ankyrin repeat protein
MWAMEQGDEDQAEALLRQNPGAVNYLGVYRELEYEDFSLLHAAACYDCPRMARLLLEMGANKDALSWNLLSCTATRR